MAWSATKLKANVASNFPCTGGIFLQPMNNIGSEIWDEELLVSLVDDDLMRMRCLLTRLVRSGSVELDAKGRDWRKLRRSKGQRDDVPGGVLIAWRQWFISRSATKIYTHLQPGVRPPEPATSKGPFLHLWFLQVFQPCHLR